MQIYLIPYWYQGSILKILYIDDHAESRLLVRHILEAEGYEVIEAQDGSSGIRVAEAESPDLILIDIMMPGLDGRETTTRLRSIPRLQAVPIVALTANMIAGDRERALAAGCNGYLKNRLTSIVCPNRFESFCRGKENHSIPLRRSATFESTIDIWQSASIRRCSGCRT